MSEKVKLNIINSEIIKKTCSEDCGAKCCRDISSDFKVPVSLNDYRRLKSANLESFVDFTGSYPFLKPKSNNSCPFLDFETNLCKIHKIRPEACRRYPFNHGKTEIEAFCELYHDKSTELRNFDKNIEEIKLSSFSEIMFDGYSDDKISNEYLNRLNQTVKI